MIFFFFSFFLTERWGESGSDTSWRGGRGKGEAEGRKELEKAGRREELGAEVEVWVNKKETESKNEGRYERNGKTRQKIVTREGIGKGEEDVTRENGDASGKREKLREKNQEMKEEKRSHL